MIKITIPFASQSVNKMYATFRGNRIKSRESREYSEKVKKVIENGSYEKLEGELNILIEIYSNWYNKNKTIKKKDLANFQKSTVDSVFDALEMDDSQIFKMILKKIQSNEEKSEITIW